MTTAAGQSTTVLRTSDLSKSFGHVSALKGVSFDLKKGEVLAVVGDNGAGKSTLIKLLSGAYDPDPGGSIEVDGTKRRFKGPLDASEAGIATVYQDLALVDTRDVASNLFLGREPRRGPFVDRKTMIAKSEEVLRDFTFRLPSVRVPVSLLSGGQRQTVAIARVLLQGAHIVIMDEPTAALGVQESERVLTLIRDLRDRGTSVIVVSHNLQQVWKTADRIMVLRLGEVAGIRHTADSSVDEVVRLIVHGGETVAD
ncbi:sugar ABC transporter ATP-binding protein [Streptomyces sp. WAC 06738]|uniref:ATP-binding cassette domain-containing protein n=1 Tax=Streptomyces sp. WAC 06738 TaxID=2203210 RepID=UPI000F6E2DF2|nr:ATP-binding cassette domain-containing protein [Streptomyces sp. WAC 06738]AZM49600.1 sugar ABC transporter ATP-binding protein [Streptomyces sp. WAC 06738]